MTSANTLPPAIILGGDTNALSAARSLAALGVTVHSLGAERYVGYSRFVRPLHLPGRAEAETEMLQYLLGPDAEPLRGAVLLGASDAALLLLARHREQLLERFLLDNCDPQAQLAMLDKLSTYETAVKAGVPTPLFWRAENADALRRIGNELVFPLIVKPLHSHEYTARFRGGTKHRLVQDRAELEASYRDVTEAGVAVMLVEKIPGPDDLLCSYYTYLDETGAPSFDLTKRVIRRSPPNQGIGCYHITDRNPEVAELALRLFRHSGLRGVANAEFVRDVRDGKLKLIECNARFTAANCLLASAGVDLVRFVYLRIVGQPEPPPTGYITGLRLLYPVDDLRSFLALRRRGELTFAAWVRSLAHRQTFPVFRRDDPAPALAHAFLRISTRLARVRANRTKADVGPSTARRTVPDPKVIEHDLERATESLVPPDVRLGEGRCS